MTSKWMVREFVPLIPSAFVWAVVAENSPDAVICIAPSKEKAELVAYEHNHNEETFYRLTEDDMQSIAKHNIGRLLTPEELKKACNAATDLFPDWMEAIDAVLAEEVLDKTCRCMHCTLDKDAKCDSDDRDDFECLPCKYCSIHPYKEVKS